MTKKTCNICNRTKPVDDFRKVPTVYGGDGYSKACKPCLTAKREAKRAASQSESEPVQRLWGQFKCEPTLGFTAELRDTDLVITQSSLSGDATVWIARAELERLLTWVDQVERARDSSSVVVDAQVSGWRSTEAQ